MMFKRNKDDQPDQRDLINQQNRGNLHSDNIKADLHAPDQGVHGADALLEVTDTDLHADRVQRLSNLISRDVPLSQLTDAETHEFRWLVRAISRVFFDMHPPETSVFQGNYRAAMSENPKDAYESVDNVEELEIFQLVEIAIMRATRGRNGWQQKQWNASYRISQILDSEGGEEGWLK